MNMLHIFTWTKVCFAQVCVFVFILSGAKILCVWTTSTSNGELGGPTTLCSCVTSKENDLLDNNWSKCIVCSNLTYEDTNTEMVSHFYTLFNFEKISLEFNLRGRSLIFSNIMTKTGGKKGYLHYQYFWYNIINIIIIFLFCLYSLKRWSVNETKQSSFTS